MVELKRSSIIVFHELVMQQENESDVLVGRPDTGRFIRLPFVGADIIKRLQCGETPGDIELALMEETAEPVDVLDFTRELLLEYEFVHRVDGEIVSEHISFRESWPWLGPVAGAVLFHPRAFGIGAIFILVTLFRVVVTPSLLPGYSELIRLASSGLSLSLACIFAWLQLLVHEAAHLAAARSLGVKGRIGLSHRFVFPVAETDMTGIVLVPHRLRYRAYLAGMLVDCFILMLSIWAQTLLPLVDPWLSVARTLEINSIALLLFQFLFFLRTDMYYVLTTLLRCEGLLVKTHCFLLSLIVKDKAAEWKEVPQREKRWVYGYSVIYLMGLIITGAWFAYYQIPFMLQLGRELAKDLLQLPPHSLEFWGSVFNLLISLLPFGILGWSWFRKYLMILNNNARMKGGEETYEKN